MGEFVYWLTVIAAVGSGLVGGIFFAFSTFIMQALARRPKAEGIAAMQAINVTVLNPWFFSAFFGTAVVCLLLVVLSLGGGPASHLILRFAAAALYLLGCILVTIAGNVPLNNRLAAVAPDTADAAPLWDHYLSRWTLWNTVRTIASLAAATLFALTL